MNEIRKYYLKETHKLRDVTILKGMYEGKIVNFGSSIQIELNDIKYSLPVEFFDLDRTN